MPGYIHRCYIANAVGCVRFTTMGNSEWGRIGLPMAHGLPLVVHSPAAGALANMRATGKIISP